MVIKTKARPAMFRDGYAVICRYDRPTSTFAAAKNARTMEDLQKVGKLAFDEMSRRQQDIDFAESADRSLSYKIRTRLQPDLCREEYCVVINGILYDVITIDTDRAAELAYWYLEEVRELEG